jgi:hypothetical protein
MMGVTIGWMPKAISPLMMATTKTTMRATARWSTETAHLALSSEP